MNPGDVLTQDYEIGLVALSYFVSVLGSFVALECAIRIYEPNGIRWGYVVCAAVALGGVAIWSMHFIGMTALKLPVDIGYNVPLTLLSLIAAVVVAAGALWYVGKQAFSVANLLVGGVIAGIAVAVMHYLGMAAMRTQALIAWNAGIVALSVLIAIAAAIVALWLAFKLEHRWLRLLAALVMGVAVNGMHYTGMAAGTFICTSASTMSAADFSGRDLPFIVFTLALLVLGAIVIHAILHWEPKERAAPSSL
jgi:NO-binding membrane sensor protein with MHYT domain